MVDIQQIIYALQRQATALDAHAEALGADYSAEFPAEDAQRMREAIELLQPMVKTNTALPEGYAQRLDTTQKPYCACHSQCLAETVLDYQLTRCRGLRK